MVCKYTGILLSHKKEASPAFVTTQIDLDGIVLRERSQAQRAKLHDSPRGRDLTQPKDRSRAGLPGARVGGEQRDTVPHI